MEKPKYILFTDETLDLLPLPTERNLYYYDTGTRGLCISIRKTGTISFQVKKSIDGHDRKLSIGQYPKMSLQDARKIVNTIRVEAKEPLSSGLITSFLQKLGFFKQKLGTSILNTGVEKKPRKPRCSKKQFSEESADIVLEPVLIYETPFQKICREKGILITKNTPGFITMYYPPTHQSITFSYNEMSPPAYLILRVKQLLGECE